MFNKILIGCVMMIVAGCAGNDAPAGSAATSRAPSMPDHYIVFFEPTASQLDSEGQAIVREAVAGIEERMPSKVEIVVPAKGAGEFEMAQSRYAAIRNLMSTSGMDAAMDSRVALASGGTNLPGADDRAEIRLIP